jgi:hypothetical protein
VDGAPYAWWTQRSPAGWQGGSHLQELPYAHVWRRWGHHHVHSGEHNDSHPAMRGLTSWKLVPHQLLQMGCVG